MFLGASEFCKLTGISIETLRHYVECGLITPEKVSAKDFREYRKYSSTNALDILHVRLCRSFDIPIPEIVQNITNATISEQEQWFSENEKRLELEEKLIRLKLRRIQKYKKLISSIKTRLGEVREETAQDGPDLYRLLLIGEGAENDQNAYEIMKHWMLHQEYIYVALSTPKESLITDACNTLPISLGIGVERKFVEELGLMVCPPVTFFPAEKNVSTVISSSNPMGLTKQDLKILYDYIEEKKYKIVSDLSGRLITYETTDKGRLYYFTVRISVEEC